MGSRLLRRVVVLAWALLAPSTAVADEATQTRWRPTTPPGLEASVEFWIDVFARYSRNEYLIHDTEDLRRVYSVLDFSHLARKGLREAEIDQIASRAVEKEKERIQTLLLRLHRTPGRSRPPGSEDARIEALFAGDADPLALLKAARSDRIRAQRGMAEKFARAIEVGHAYFPHMEKIFREEGVPEEITRLALVESGFDLRAYSRRGATGLWQFIRSTGRRFMRIDEAVDERRDPFVSTRAAARYLRENYEKLGSWPLAITAYNHGPQGMARAVRQLGTTDLVEIIESYGGPAFRFASRNFYAEFLAAWHVEREHYRYFGPLDLHEPLRTRVFVLPDYVDLDVLARAAGITAEELMELNPALSRRVYDGKLRVPRGYALRLPEHVGDVFGLRYASIPAELRFAKQKRTYIVHRVKRGQTLWAIARRYGTTVDAIRRRNNIRDADRIRTGQLLRIPRS